VASFVSAAACAPEVTKFLVDASSRQAVMVRA
jgi:hypothetical protein